MAYPGENLGIQRCFPIFSSESGDPRDARQNISLPALVRCIELTKKVFEKPAKSGVGLFASGYSYTNLPSTLFCPGPQANVARPAIRTARPLDQSSEQVQAFLTEMADGQVLAELS